ncbi:MAG: YggT family protein [Chloroflexi bacterium]|nr:YggT family protein [Chloroflexota bacterium]
MLDAGPNQEVLIVDEKRVVERQSVTTPPADTTTYVEPVAEPVRAPAPVSNTSVVSETVRHSPSGAEVARRVVVFIFGIIQALIVIRIVLLLADANQANQLVRFLYDTSAFFVGPFEGILNTNAVQAGASIFDIAALVALIGWTILEVLIIALIGIARREP